MAADPGRVEVVDCGLEVDDEPGARSVGRVEDLVDLFTLRDDPLVGADGLCQLDGVGVTLLQVGYATAMGFGFAAVTLRTGVIWPLIIIHGLTNAAGFVAAGGTISTGVTSTDVMVSAIYIVGFTIYGVIVLQTAQRPMARPTAGAGTLTRSSDPQ